MSTKTAVLKPLRRLVNWDANYRIGDVLAIRRSIERFGFLGALRTRGNVVYAGNHVLKALKELEAEGAEPPQGIQVRSGRWYVATIPIDHLTESEAVAFAIADNRTAELATNDAEKLLELLGHSRETGLLEFTGYDDDAFAALLRECGGEENVPPIEEPEDVQPDEKQSRVLPGDLWGLGDHRIICGDSSDAETVTRLMNGEKAILFATDPPYFVDYNGDNRPSEGKDWSHVYNEISEKDAPAFLAKVLRNAIEHCYPDAAWYVWHADTRRRMIEEVWDELALLFHQCVYWIKPVPVITYNTYHVQHEPCMHGWRRGNKPPSRNSHAERAKSVWVVDHDGSKIVRGNEHPTQKPLELFMIPMRTHTLPGELCLELFSGSGSQILAADSLGRRCYAAEISPVFVDVAIRRWENATGKEAVLIERR